MVFLIEIVTASFERLGELGRLHYSLEGEQVERQQGPEIDHRRLAFHVQVASFISRKNRSDVSPGDWSKDTPSSLLSRFTVSWVSWNMQAPESM